MRSHKTGSTINQLGFFDAAAYLGRGWKLIRQPGLRRFVVVPIVINVIVFAVLGWLLFGTLTDWLSGWTFFERFGDIWLVDVIRKILQFAVGAILSVVLVYAFTLLANLVGAPFNSLLAERVEMHLTGQSPAEDPSLMFLLKSIPKTLMSEVSKLIYLALWSVPLLLLGFVPLVNIAAPFLVFAFGAWMFALEYIDYPLGNHGMLFKGIRQTMRQRRTAAFGFGAIVALFSIIPLVNLIIMPVAVAGATALYVDHLREDASLGDAT